MRIWTVARQLTFVPKVNTCIGTSASAVDVSTLWNMLLTSVKSVENIAKSRRHFKTYLYNLAYPPWRINQCGHNWNCLFTLEID